MEYRTEKNGIILSYKVGENIPRQLTSAHKTEYIAEMRTDICKAGQLVEYMMEVVRSFMRVLIAKEYGDVSWPEKEPHGDYLILERELWDEWLKKAAKPLRDLLPKMFNVISPNTEPSSMEWHEGRGFAKASDLLKGVEFYARRPWYVLERDYKAGKFDPFEWYYDAPINGISFVVKQQGEEWAFLRFLDKYIQVVDKEPTEQPAGKVEER